MPETISAPGSPPPGAYIVGTVLGLRKITTKANKTVRFLRVDDGSDTHEMLLPDSELDEYPASCVGEVRIVPVRLGVREYNGKADLSMVIQAAGK